jgi:hypothetical protein
VTFTHFFTWSRYFSFILKIVVLVHVINWDSVSVAYCPLIPGSSLGAFLDQSQLHFLCKLELLPDYVALVCLPSKCQLFTTAIWNRGHCSVDALIILPEIQHIQLLLNPLSNITMFPVAAGCFARSSMPRDLQS